MSCSVKNLGGGTELVREETYTYTQTNTYIDHSWMTYNEFKSLLKKYSKIFMSVECWSGSYNADFIIMSLPAVVGGVGNTTAYTREIDCKWALDALETLENQSVASGFKDTHFITGLEFSGKTTLRYASTTSSANQINVAVILPHTKAQVDNQTGVTVRCSISGVASIEYSTIVKWKLWGQKA